MAAPVRRHGDPIGPGMSSPTLSTSSWLRECDALVAGAGGSTGGPVGGAHALLVELVDAAAAYVAEHGCLHAGGGRCALDAVPGGRAACELARAFVPRPAPTHPGGATSRYLTALAHAAASVYYCRRVAHPAGTCWFGAPLGLEPGADGCGRVLAAAHALR